MVNYVTSNFSTFNPSPSEKAWRSVWERTLLKDNSVVLPKLWDSNPLSSYVGGNLLTTRLPAAHKKVLKAGCLDRIACFKSSGSAEESRI